MKSKNLLNRREVSLPLSDESILDNPENIKLRFGTSGTVDIGTMCYLDRTSSFRGITKIWNIRESSFCPYRTNSISKLAAYISEEFSSGNKRPNTVYKMFSDFMGFINWCDSNDSSHIFLNQKDAVIIFRKYLDHLRDQVNQNTLNLNTASKLQNVVLEILSNFFEYPNFQEGINLLKRDSKASKATDSPSLDSQARVLSLCNDLFMGLSELVLENKAYPFKLHMPKYLNWEKDYLWVFPTARWYMTPTNIAERHKLKNAFWGYDYMNGGVAILDEIVMHYSSIYSAKYAIRDAQNLILESNREFYHRRRRDAAVIAFNSFIQLFVANTGMNWSQVRELYWNDEFDVGVTRQGFRVIKYRAQNRIVSFEIQNIFLPYFKKFIILRNYLLRGEKFDRLFFGYGNNLTENSIPYKLNINAIDKLYDQLIVFDPKLPRVMTRQWRAAKSDFLVRNYDISTTAILLQNTENTVRKSYIEGSISVAIEEVSTYFDRVSSVVAADKSNSLNETKCPIGRCVNYGSPSKVAESNSIVPDCLQPEGCLFCDNYRVHADELDIRKLFSCKQCINMTAHLAESEEHFQSLFGPVMARVNGLINQISMTNKLLVDRIKKEVEENGELDTYWAKKLEMLIYLGVI